MAAPAVGWAVVEGGKWAIAAWRAWRVATATTAVVGAAAVTNEAIQNAQEDARSTPVPAVDACSTCGPPGCGPLNEEIRDLRDELEERHRDMRIDRYDLFNRAYSASNPLYLANGARIGSWEGHVRQFREKQNRLRRKVAEAREMGCDIATPDADRWSTISAPSRPG
ncbi:MAG: hypothetical protein ACK4GW_10475 [Pseudorhodobacter sp.]